MYLKNVSTDMLIYIFYRNSDEIVKTEDHPFLKFTGALAAATFLGTFALSLTFMIYK